ncbi:MAG: TadE/TadG family type IV pilus assembly protein [Beijerinckiaceae bacterium]
MKSRIKEMDRSARSSGLFGSIRALARDNKGVAAIEFAFIVPIMFSFYFMLNETANGMRASRKVTMVARIMADLSSRPANVSDAELNDIFSAGTPIMAPFDTSTGGYRITSIRFNGAVPPVGYVDWSRVSGTGFSEHPRCTPSQTVPGNPLPPIAIPTGLQTANTSLILAEVAIPYTPSVGWNITGVINLRDQLYMRPRNSAFVTRNGVTNAACP